jgi:hypothetical protein
MPILTSDADMFTCKARKTLEPATRERSKQEEAQQQRSPYKDRDELELFFSGIDETEFFRMARYATNALY